MNAPFTVSASMFSVFADKWSRGDFPHQRYGQAFHNYFMMHKMTPTVWADVLYNATDKVAQGMVQSAIDWSN